MQVRNIPKIPKFKDLVNQNSKIITLRSSLTEPNLRTYLFRFFNETKFNSKYIFVLVKISYQDILDVRTLGYKTIIDTKNETDIKNYVNSVSTYFNEHDDMYHPQNNDRIIISWLDTNNVIYNRSIKNKKINKFELTNIPKYHDIPFNVSYNSWGIVKILNINKSIINNITFNSNINFIEIDQTDSLTKLVTITFNDGNTFKFIEIDLRDEGNNYKRVFLDNNVEIYFKDNIAFFYFDPNIALPRYAKDKAGNLTNERVDIIKPLTEESKISGKFITFDLETYFNKDNSINLLSASFYDGKRSYSVYRGNFKTDNEMLDNIFKVLLSKYYNGRFIYIHNGARFDLTFLVNYLLDRKDIKLEPLYKDGIFLSLTIKFGKNLSVTIRDSYLLLPSSLSKLGKSLGVECQKDIYPYFCPKS